MVQPVRVQEASQEMGLLCLLAAVGTSWASGVRFAGLSMERKPSALTSCKMFPCGMGCREELPFTGSGRSRDAAVILGGDAGLRR